MRQVRRSVFILSMPAHLIARVIGRIYAHDPKKGRVVVGVVLMLVGASLASIEQHIVPRFLQDMIAWGIHGVGVTPVASHLISE